jgi:hypothetical protein
MRRTILVSMLAAAILLNGAATIAQQPPKKNPNKPRNPQTGKQASAVAPVIPVGQSFHAFASWLEDADVVEPKTASLGFGVGRWEGLEGGETDAPTFDFAIGVAPRFQLSASLPFYWASYSGGFTSRGRGDATLALKVCLMDASEHLVGLAIAPTIEVLSDLAVAGPTLGLSRVN